MPPIFFLHSRCFPRYNLISYPGYSDRDRLDAAHHSGGSQVGKTPGVDGLLTELYSQFQEVIAPKLTTLFMEFTFLSSLPDTMEEAGNVLVPKLGKDPQDCASYCPIFIKC